MTEIVGAVLAAGAGSRFGSPKAEVLVAGERLIDRAVRTLWQGGCDRVVVVVRPGVAVTHAEVVVNEDADRGMRSSLALAVDAANEADALVVVLVDMPGVEARAVTAVIATWSPQRVVLASYEDQGAHPIVMSPEMWARALELADPDEGAKNFLAAHPELVEKVPADGTAQDIDTVDDLGRWNGALPTD